MYLIIIIFFIFVSSFFGQNLKNEQTDSIITWDKNRNLNWGDFKGTVGWDDPLGNAMTSYKIEVIPENVLVDENDQILNYEDLSVVANFYCYHSWVNKSTYNLLKHEQTHFNIAELFARKLRKRFWELKNEEEKRFSIYYSEHMKFFKMCRNMQEKYDQETQHGNDFEGNDTWDMLIQRELNSLKEFE